MRASGSPATPAERGRARAVFNRLEQRYPEISTALGYVNPWQLLVSTVLSAQTTDETVNRVTPVLFDRYPAPEDLADASIDDVEEIVKPTGFYRQKTQSIVSLAVDIVERFGGEVPRTLDELVTLKGVGRKTASVVLAEVWGIPAIAVDTHVKRVTGRIGLTSETDPTKIEQDLKALYGREKWSGISMRFIQFGRDICDARNPRCFECEMFKICDWPEKRVR